MTATTTAAMDGTRVTAVGCSTSDVGCAGLTCHIVTVIGSLGLTACNVTGTAHRQTVVPGYVAEPDKLAPQDCGEKRFMVKCEATDRVLYSVTGLM